MWIQNLEIENIKGFKDSVRLEFAKSINVLVGANNSGKSTILQALLFLQAETLTHLDVRKSIGLGTIDIKFDGDSFDRFSIANPNKVFNKNPVAAEHSTKIHIEINALGNISKRFLQNDGSLSTFNNFLPAEPNNLFYPFLSKRKVGGYSETVGLNYARQVSGSLAQLTSKIDRLSDPNFPKHKEYREACINILGYPISATQSENGKKIGLTVDAFNTIPIEAMGEGVPNVLGLIADLCLAENQIFLIEELENDIHPKSLKGLLNLIISKSSTNQFFISTHSNIVTKILGSSDSSKIFNISMNFETGGANIPLSTIKEVENNPDARRKILEDLGYDFFDNELWAAWLFLEESSAEILIREYFIPWFFPNLLGKLKTFSSRTVSEVEPKFEDFNRLFVYLHLTKIYKNHAWVIVDAGDEEVRIIRKMKDYYTRNGWKESQFKQFSNHDFEEYYPEDFKEKFAKIKEAKKEERQSMKKALLEEVLGWIKTDEEKAKQKFSVSAKEVLEILNEISISVK